MKGNKQQLINLLSNMANLLSNILIGLFFTPYLVKTLGIAAYGVLPLALLINSYINVVTGALVGAMTRFYSIELVASKFREASEYISVAFISLFSFIIILSPFITLFILNIDSVLNIPIDYINDSRILFIYIILSFFLSMCSSLLNITQFAMNRLDIMNIIKIGRNVFKVIFVFLFFSFYSINLANIGLSFFLAEVVVLLMSYYFFKRESDKNLHISYKLFNIEKFKTLLNMIFWVLLLHIGEVVLFRIDNLVINKFWSTVESGVVGVFSEFGMYINSVLAVIISLASPLIVINYSKGNIKEMVSIFINNYYVTNFFLLILSSVCISYSSEIISFWLDDSYTKYSMWFCLKILFVPFIIYISIYNTMFRVYNKLKVPSYLMIICGLIGLGLMCLVGFYSLSFSNELNAVSILLLMGLVSLFLNLLSTSVYLHRLNKDISVSSLLKPLLVMLITLPIAKLFSIGLHNILPCENFFHFMIHVFILSIIIALLLYRFSLSKNVKKYMLEDMLSRKRS